METVLYPPGALNTGMETVLYISTRHRVTTNIRRACSGQWQRFWRFLSSGWMTISSLQHAALEHNVEVYAETNPNTTAFVVYRRTHTHTHTSLDHGDSWHDLEKWTTQCIIETTCTCPMFRLDQTSYCSIHKCSLLFSANDRQKEWVGVTSFEQDLHASSCTASHFFHANNNN